MRRSNLVIVGVAVVVSCSLGMGQSPKGQKKEGSGGDASKGQEVFQQCRACHNADTTERRGGPGLKGLFKAEKMASGAKPTEANVRAQIDNGGDVMPPYKELLSTAEKNDLIAYLKTL